MRKYPIFFLISCAIYIFHIYISGHGIYGDGNGYFALAHTLFFSKNLNFAPVYGYLSRFHGPSFVFSRVFWDVKPTSMGILNCPWLIGTSLMWMFGFFVVTLISLLFSFHLSAFSLVYEFVGGLTGIICVLIGLWFIEQSLGIYFDSKSASRTVILLFGGTQLFYYCTLEPALSHQPAFLFITILLYVAVRRRDSLPFSFLTGLLIGLLLITRINEGMIIVPVLAWLYYASKDKTANQILSITSVIVGFGIGITPQLLLQKALYGSYFSNPYLIGAKGTFQIPTVGGVFNSLFAPQGGFISTTPVFAVGAFFLPRWIKNIDKSKINASLIYSVEILYILFVASWFNSPPAGFGNRFFIQTIPFLAFGITYFFSTHRKYAKSILAASFVWNIFSLVAFFLLK